MKEKETVTACDDIALVIPVCDPDAERFPPLVRRLREDFTHVVVVDDGSARGREAFDAVRGDVDVVLVHEVNRGKGAAGAAASPRARYRSMGISLERR